MNEQLSRQTEVTGLGKLHRVFRPKKANLIAGVILGLLLMIGGVAAAIGLSFRASQQAPSAGEKILVYGLIGILGVLLPLCGVALLVWMKRLFSHEQ